MPPSFSALAGGSVPEDEAALRGHAHRPQMASDSSPLPQAVGAGAGAGWGWGVGLGSGPGEALQNPAQYQNQRLSLLYLSGIKNVRGKVG